MAKIEFNIAEFAAGAVSRLPFGQRSKSVVARAPVVSTLNVTTKTALSPKETRVISIGASHARYDASAKAEQTEKATLATVIAQPHRRDAEDPRDPRLAFPLGRFCEKAWPRDQRFRDAVHAAGSSYADEVRATKIARGFHVEGGDSDSLLGGGDGGDPTAEQIEADRAEIQAAERTLANANGELRGVMMRCPAAMVRLCCDHTEPLANDVDMLKHGLFALATHYGHWRRAGY